MCTTTAGGTSASAPMAAGICALVLEAKEIPNEPNGKIELNIRTDMCRKYIKNLEQIEAVLSIQFHPRGNLEIHLTSDSGTSSQLLQPRPNDVHEKYFLNWSFTSVHFWGERIGKRWNLTLINNGKHEAKKSGKLHSYQLIFHGI
ncbi:hypothetical protein B4U79_06416 [Dinothrombium tinctorium]|uniref:P/Homo B domain-containing protein n=1 Tax=Dinothrombium tinctorium TaxID=1965070 RepID=A0A443RJZ3_9ACAR|nr:hypothetical protein B4U79_06416 [Dinothrombium tinctorium]